MKYIIFIIFVIVYSSLTDNFFIDKLTMELFREETEIINELDNGNYEKEKYINFLSSGTYDEKVEKRCFLISFMKHYINYIATPQTFEDVVKLYVSLFYIQDNVKFYYMEDNKKQYCEFQNMSTYLDNFVIDGMTNMVLGYIRPILDDDDDGESFVLLNRYYNYIKMIVSKVDIINHNKLENIKINIMSINIKYKYDGYSHELKEHTINGLTLVDILLADDVDNLIKLLSLLNLCSKNIIYSWECNYRTLTELTIMYSATKCFKYLLISELYKKDLTDSENRYYKTEYYISRYIANTGNIEILHLAEKYNLISYDILLEFSIIMHKNDIVKYIFNTYYDDDLFKSLYLNLIENYNYQCLIDFINIDDNKKQTNIHKNSIHSLQYRWPAFIYVIKTYGTELFTDWKYILPVFISSNYFTFDMMKREVLDVIPLTSKKDISLIIRYCFRYCKTKEYIKQMIDLLYGDYGMSVDDIKSINISKTLNLIYYWNFPDYKEEKFRKIIENIIELLLFDRKSLLQNDFDKITNLYKKYRSIELLNLLSHYTANIIK